MSDQLNSFQERTENAKQYISTYQNYCWSVTNISDLKLAPFYILATEGAVHVDKTHGWHMEEIARIATYEPDILVSTNYKVIDFTDASSKAGGTH